VSSYQANGTELRSLPAAAWASPSFRVLGVEATEGLTQAYRSLELTRARVFHDPMLAQR